MVRATSLHPVLDCRLDPWQRGHRRLRIKPLQQIQSDLRPSQPFPRQAHRGRFQMRPARIDIRRVPQPELQVDRRRHPHDFRDLIVPDETANIIGDLNIDRSAC
jgi:hypothetical protein